MRLRRSVCPLHYCLRSAIDECGSVIGAAIGATLAGLRLHGPRRIQPYRLRRSYLACGRARLAGFGADLRRPDRADIGLPWRLDRLGHAAADRHPAITALAGHGIVDDGLPGALAKEHDHRDLDRANPLF